MKHLIHDPYLVWYVLFAVLCTMVAIPPRGWRAWVVAACWLVVLIVLLLHFF